MRAAILADIHSNLTALEAVLADVERRGRVDEVWCLGDIVGYGPEPHRCIETIKERCHTCIAGNHDQAAADKLDISYFNPEAAEAAGWTTQHLEKDDIRFLENLPLILEKGDFTLAHGSPRDPILEYVLSTAVAEESLKHFQTRYCLIGHSHLALLFECGRHCSGSELAPESEVKLGNKRLIINPGSVGQPRNDDPRAQYAVYDAEAGRITFHRVEYDISITQQKMLEAKLPHWLIHRLALGR